MVPPFSWLLKDLAIDLGTANTLVYMKGRGVLVSEPSVVTVELKTNRILAVGREAKEMLGKAPGHVSVIRPLKDGVISDFRVTEEMLRYFIKKVCERKYLLVRPRIVVAIPSGITEVEKKAVKDSVLQAGASEVHLIEEPMAAAIGVGLPVEEPSGSMIVDIGGGTTEVAVISMAGIVYSRSIRVAGDEMDEAIAHYIKKKHNLLIGERTAEYIKIALASAHPLEKEETLEIRGRDLVEGIPKTLVISSEEVRDALSEIAVAIVEAVRTTLERTPPELSADIIDKGIVLTGGGSLLRNLDSRLREETGLPITLAEDPLTSVALGAGKVLDNMDLLSKISVD
ncbi:MAG: rod shape-determining protein [Nitrospira sp.]|nr:rod shape-determining protein [Nitrospira sp.]